MLRLTALLCLAPILACSSSPAADSDDGGTMDATTDPTDGGTMDAAADPPDSSVPSDGCTGSAEYEIVFVATWSAETHPDGFPGGPHFSPLIGAVHDDSFDMWTVGELATDGIESMAETGSTSSLASEVEAAEPATSEVRGGGVGVSPGTATTTFVATADLPLLSITTMLAPSPDWFAGLDAVALCVEDAWVDSLELDAILYDAGTDSGSTYVAPNDDTNPAEAIRALDEAPFHDGSDFIPVGRFEITRLD